MSSRKSLSSYAAKSLWPPVRKELPLLDNLFKRGHENGLQNLKMLSAEELKEHEPHVAGLKGFFVPQTGIVDYKVVTEKYAEVFQNLGGTIEFNTEVKAIKSNGNGVLVETSSGDFEGTQLVNCGGLYSDKIAKRAGANDDIKIVPFRGEYYKLAKEKEYLVKQLIYPVPDPNFPFLGVHFTRMMKGGVEAGPNAVLAYAREGYTKGDINLSELAETLTWPGFQKVAMKYWKTGMGELYRSYSKAAFTKALQKLIPEITEKDLVPGGAGVRAQACDRTGGLIDDFVIREKDNAVHICNAPSPAATSSLSIGKTVADIMTARF